MFYSPHIRPNSNVLCTLDLNNGSLSIWIIPKYLPNHHCSQPQLCHPVQRSAAFCIFFDVCSLGQICICYVIYNIHSIVQHNCIKHWAVDKYACLCSGALSKAKARDKSELGRCIWAKANRESSCCVFHHSLLHSEPQLNVIVSEQNLFVQSQFWNSFLVRLCGN